ncbi:hypothetical protein I317_04366 [Kwoniella heveanensis CBS 569]|nr:hypothetical protein I317_04366 [Kwoniella heveanensis CBS 569]
MASSDTPTSATDSSKSSGPSRKRRSKGSGARSSSTLKGKKKSSRSGKRDRVDTTDDGITKKSSSSRKNSSSRSGKQRDRSERSSGGASGSNKTPSRSDPARKKPSSSSERKSAPMAAADGARPTAPKNGGDNGENDGTRGGVMAKQCSDFRFYMLFMSGGWMGDLIMTLSDITGVWEFAWLAILFVASWTVLRISQVEITLLLGHIFDLTIPLQHQFNTAKQKAHASHLDQYWPLFFVGTIVEFGSFILVHPDLFTLIACIKTLALLSLWLGRDKNGRFLTSRFEGRGSASVSPSSGTDKDGSGRGGRDEKPEKKDGGLGDIEKGKDRARRGSPTNQGRSQHKKDSRVRDKTSDEEDQGGDGGSTSDSDGSSNASTPASTTTPSLAGASTPPASSLNPSWAASTPSSASQTESPVTAGGEDGSENAGASIPAVTDGGGSSTGNDGASGSEVSETAAASEATKPGAPAGGRKHPYDSRGFTGNLMPIRKPKPKGPR